MYRNGLGMGSHWELSIDCKNFHIAVTMITKCGRRRTPRTFFTPSSKTFKEPILNDFPGTGKRVYFFKDFQGSVTTLLRKMVLQTSRVFAQHITQHFTEIPCTSAQTRDSNIPNSKVKAQINTNQCMC